MWLPIFNPIEKRPSPRGGMIMMTIPCYMYCRHADTDRCKQSAVWNLDDFPGMEMKDLYDFFMYIFCDQDKLELKLWTAPIAERAY